VYRNGLLHVVTLSSKTRSGRELPGAELSHDFLSSVAIARNGHINLNPVLFAEQVLKIIENDFKTFEISTLTFPQEYQIVVSGRLP
jgi:hypothetical protein